MTREGRWFQMLEDTMTDETRPPFRLGGHPADAYHLAWTLLEESSPLKALEVLDPALELEPGSASLRTLRAWAYFQSAQLGNAEVELARLVEENPTDVWARFSLGRVLERQSRYAEALPHLRLAAVMSGDPEHQTGVLRCERKLAETGSGSYDDLT
jgi:predicted Zn-dependent protease